MGGGRGAHRGGGGGHRDDRGRDVVGGSQAGGGGPWTISVLSRFFSFVVLMLFECSKYGILLWPDSKARQIRNEARGVRSRGEAYGRQEAVVVMPEKGPQIRKKSLLRPSFPTSPSLFQNGLLSLDCHANLPRFHDLQAS